MKIKVQDLVQITSGKDKGKQAKVLAVLPRTQMVVVEGINTVIRHKKPQYGQAGERVTLTKPISVSKVAIINQNGEVDRVGYKQLKDGSKVRIFKKSGQEIVGEIKPVTKKVKTEKKSDKTEKVESAKKSTKKK